MKAHVKHLKRGKNICFFICFFFKKNLAILPRYGHTIARALSQSACKHISPPPLPPPLLAPTILGFSSVTRGTKWLFQ